jgi:hypothetical protein|tara:strand:- start:380 stop:658 length:279 start_codon:yes stop_codon:yes gene_type:complete
MEGKNYLRWFSDEHKVKWLGNFHEEGSYDFNEFMERDFKHYLQFFFLGFDVEKTKEGRDYWTSVYYQYKKYDNINIKIGYSPKLSLKTPRFY